MTTIKIGSFVIALSTLLATACSVDDRNLTPTGPGGTAGGGTASDASIDAKSDGAGGATGIGTGSGAGGGGAAGATGGGGGADGGCQGGALRCSAGGVPQKCVAGVFEDQAPCPTDMPVCDEASGACVSRCIAGAKRCSPSGTAIQQCDTAGSWQDTTTCPFACTGTGEAAACGGMCKPGTRTCGANNTPFLCDTTGTNQAQTACSTACVGDGACMGDCKPGATRCTAGSTNKVDTCGANGTWGPSTACTFVCDSTKQDCGGECAPGTANRCSNSTVQSCDATGHWKDMTNCGTTPCSMGECRACSPNQKQCNASKPQTCTAGGTWADDQANACPFVCDAATGKCAGECVPGSDACTGSSTKHCGANGVYAAPTACPNICDATTGKCGGVCAPNAHRCNGSSAQICGSIGQWGSDMPCPYGCASTTGLCNACTDEPMATTCANGKCGPTTNNCAHTVQCSTSCAGTGQTCGGGGVNGVCGCTPQSSGTTCQGNKCGSVANNCGQSVSCPGCNLPQTCGGGGTPGVCGCTAESNAAFCSRLGKACGTFTGADNCGVMRTVPSCGSCTGQQVCTAANACVTPNCSGASSCGMSDGAGGFCNGALGHCPAKPNTSAVCQTSCQYTCDKNPLSCSTTSNPACGVWTFESGTTEGWTLRPDSVVPAGTTIGSVTAFAFEGTHSLAVSYSSSGQTSLKFNVKLCPTGNAIALVGKTLHAAVRFERSSGIVQGDAYLALYNGSTQITGWADATAQANGGWVEMNGDIVSGLLGTSPDAVTDVAVVVNMGDATSGTVYVDGVTLQ